MSRHACTLLVLTLALAPAVAHADLIGGTGTAIELEVNHSTADAYLQFHGRLVLTAAGRDTEYRWGGTSCSNKTLPESQVTMLQRALESATSITPRYVSGQGLNKCLVGFTVRAP
ncbi:MAG: hypothetical protein IPL61_34490 [Myxococcales bacterium]|nr:hypothetical protein [Myxococcales bacterium]